MDKRTRERKRRRKNRKTGWKIKHADIRVYGITPRQCDAILESQDNRCAICGAKPDRALCLDHDHKTMRARGWLCGSCNSGLGFFRDHSYLLQRAIDYIRRGSIIPELFSGYSYKTYARHKDLHPEMNPRHIPRTVTLAPPTTELVRVSKVLPDLADNSIHNTYVENDSRITLESFCATLDETQIPQN